MRTEKDFQKMLKEAIPYSDGESIDEEELLELGKATISLAGKIAAMIIHDQYENAAEKFGHVTAHTRMLEIFIEKYLEIYEGDEGKETQ